MEGMAPLGISDKVIVVPVGFEKPKSKKKPAVDFKPMSDLKDHQTPDEVFGGNVATGTKWFTDKIVLIRYDSVSKYDPESFSDKANPTIVDEQIDKLVRMLDSKADAEVTIHGHAKGDKNALALLTAGRCGKMCLDAEKLVWLQRCVDFDTISMPGDVAWEGAVVFRKGKEPVALLRSMTPGPIGKQFEQFIHEMSQPKVAEPVQEPPVPVSAATEVVAPRETTAPAAPTGSFKIGCKSEEREKWSYNALRFRTAMEAEAWGQDLRGRWMGLHSYEVHPSDEPATHMWNFETGRCDELPKREPITQTAKAVAEVKPPEVVAAKVPDAPKTPAKPIVLPSTTHRALDSEPMRQTEKHVVASALDAEYEDLLRKLDELKNM